jgi:hypothetical protein
MLHLAKIGGNFQMKKEMSKLNLGRANPKEIVEGILKGEIPTPACIFCREVRTGTLLVFASLSGQYAFCSVCENCISSEMIESKMEVIEKRVVEIYSKGGNTNLEEQMFKGKIVSREVGEA